MHAEAFPLRRLLALCLLLTLTAWATGSRADPLADALADFGVQTPKKTVSAPDFSLPRLGGGSLSLSALRGKVVILHFWATWCGPCREEMPRIEALWKSYGPRLAILGVNVDQGNRSGVARFEQALHIDFPCVLDAAGDVNRRYGIRALPTSYLIDRQGDIIGRVVGERDWGSPAAQVLIKRLLSPGHVTATGASRRYNDP